MTSDGRTYVAALIDADLEDITDEAYEAELEEAQAYKDVACCQGT